MAEHGCMEPTGRDARVGASVVGGKREFALSHPRIYPTPSSQGAGLRYHPCRPAPRPSVFSPAFFSPIGRPSRRPAGDAPFADRTRVGVRVLDATSSWSTPLLPAGTGTSNTAGDRAARYGGRSALPRRTRRTCPAREVSPRSPRNCVSRAYRPR